MSFRSRYFWVDDNDSLHRFPASRYHRVFAGEEPVLEFSGQQIRFVEAIVETENRKTVSITRLLYILVTFKEDGFIDEEVKDQELRAAVGLMASTFLEKQREENLLRSGGRFEKSQLESRFRWRGSSELEHRIVKEIFSGYK